MSPEPLERVRAYLQQHDPTLEPLLFDEPLHTSEAAAAKLKVALGQVAKSILFRSNDRYGLFVAAGDVRIDPKVVKSHLGGKKPRIARPEEVEAMTGFQVGAVCPFALKEAVPVYVDVSLRRFDKVYTAAGVAASLLPVTFDRLVALTDATVVSAAEP